MISTGEKNLGACDRSTCSIQHLTKIRIANGYRAAAGFFGSCIVLVILEWLACLLGILGAVLVAVKSPHAHWAWVLWFISNASWTIHGLNTGNYALALQQAAFLLTSAVGVWHWLLLPMFGRVLTGAAPQAIELPESA